MNEHYYEEGYKLALAIAKPPPRWGQNRPAATQMGSQVERPLKMPKEPPK